MRMPARLSGEAFSLDSFLIYRRRFFSKDSGFEWSWDLFSEGEILSGLEFRLEKEPEGTSSLRFRYTVSGDDGEVARFDYRVDLDRTPCRQGGRWWFRCPYLGDGGAPCGERCRLLYLQRGQERFACRRCSALAYTSSKGGRRRRHHQPTCAHRLSRWGCPA